MEINLNNFKRIIIVAYRFPFRLVKKKNEFSMVQNSGGLVLAILSLSQKSETAEGTPLKIVWIGTGDRIAALKPESNFELHPVTIPAGTDEKFYGGFCNNTIWPFFDYFPSRTVYNNSDFEAYKSANNIFFKKLRSILQPEDFVWIHDYHLFLLPDILPMKNSLLGNL